VLIKRLVIRFVKFLPGHGNERAINLCVIDCSVIHYKRCGNSASVFQVSAIDIISVS
jgi:hypothetical protein